MRTLHLVAPDLHPLVHALADIRLSDMETLQQTRAFVEGLATLEETLPQNVKRTEIKAPLRDGTDIRALLYQNTHSNCGASLMHIHGGGLVMGMPEMNDARHIDLCTRFGLTILAPTYRVAPEHPYPTPLNDCLDVWDWFHDNASKLGIDKNRVVLSGDSAGGCLAASASQVIRDNDSGLIAHLMLLYPMLDAMTGTKPTKIDPLLGEFGWTAEMNRFGWRSYLDGTPQEAPANPAAVKSFKNLPSCWIGVGSLDLFLDENIRYARNLIAAGIATELDIYPAAIHGFPMMAKAQSTQDFLRDYANSLTKALRLRDD